MRDIIRLDKPLLCQPLTEGVLVHYLMPCFVVGDGPVFGTALTEREQFSSLIFSGSVAQRGDRIGCECGYSLCVESGMFALSALLSGV